MLRTWVARWFFVALAGAVVWAQPAADRFSGRPRVVVLSDIGNEPDDQMSLIRFLLYSNELDVEALVATTSTWQKAAVHPETMHALVAAYGQVRPKLLLHAAGWPTAAELDGRIYAGQAGYGLAATGAGKSSAGAEALIRAADRADERPLWVCVWGGANTLAQALLQVKATRDAAALQRFVEKLRVYSISDQDDAGPWIRREFPALSYVVAPSAPNSGEYYYATWTGISGDVYYRNCDGAEHGLVTNAWLDAHVRSQGPLGKLYPQFLFIMEGDTPSFLGLLNNGLNSYRRADWGGWGGRYVWRQPYGETHPIWTQGGDLFSRVTSQDSVNGADGRVYVSDQATVWRWRAAYQNDFAARMAWSVSEFAQANHNPKVVVNGVAGTAPLELTVKAGDRVVLDAAGTTDPDGQGLHYEWFHYAEAGGTGTNLADVAIAGAQSAQATVTVKAACRPQWLGGVRPCRGDGVAHVILAVTDDGSPALTSYRRVVLTVRAER